MHDPPVEPAHDERQRRVTVASSYLDQAVDELRASGSSDSLFPVHMRAPITATRKVSARIQVLGESLARGRRVQRSRSSVLYSILAAEAYANQYLQWHLSREEFSAADRLPTFDKFLLGPRLVRGNALLKRGAEPAQTLRDLLALRSKLVHPKVPTGENVGTPGLFDDPAEFAVYNPRDAARYIVAVADCASWLLANSEPAHFDIVAAAIDGEREIFLEYGERATTAMPKHTDPPAPDLLQSAYTRLAERAKDH